MSSCLGTLSEIERARLIPLLHLSRRWVVTFALLLFAAIGVAAMPFADASHSSARQNDLGFESVTSGEISALAKAESRFRGPTLELTLSTGAGRGAKCDRPVLRFRGSIPREMPSRLDLRAVSLAERPPPLAS